MTKHFFPFSGNALVCLGRVLLGLVFTSLTLCPRWSWGASEAAAVPFVQIQADRLEHNNRNQLSVMTGHVVLQRGDLSVFADWLSVQRFSDAEAHLEAKGAPVSFRKARSASGEEIEGCSKKMRYDTKTEQMVLQGNAKVVRFEKGQKMDEITADQIIYDVASGAYSVTGLAEEGRPPNRVQVVIRPRANAVGDAEKGSSPPSDIARP